MSAARPTRVRAAPAFLHHEQEALHVLSAAVNSERDAWSCMHQNMDDSDDEDMEEEEEVKESEASMDLAENNTWSDQYAPQTPAGFRNQTPRRSVPHHCTTPLQYFSLFITDSFIDHVVRLTNDYGEERAAHSAHPTRNQSQSHTQWQPTTAAEIKALLGCLIYMGIVRLTDTRDYWSQATAQPFITTTFTRDRFLELLRRLRFNTPSALEAAERDPLHPIAQLTNLLLEVNKRYFAPGKYQSADEAMVGFQGRSTMIQHIATKAEDTGFKVWMLVDCKTDYVVTFDVYTGAKNKRKEENLSAKVVLKLVNDGLSAHHHVIVMDNYFTSVYLLKELLAMHQYAIGTAQPKRKEFPKRALTFEGKRGQWKWRQYIADPRITAVAWQDTKTVYFLSSCTNPETQESTQRQQGPRELTVSCPPVTNLYMQYMRGVDVFSQRRSYSQIGRKSRKYFYSLIWFLVDLAIHNSYILWQTKHNRQNYRQKDYRKELMQELAKSYSGRHKASRAPKRQYDSVHRIKHAEHSGDCKLCRPKLQRGQHGRQSRYQCEDCDIYLCMPECYNKHIQLIATERRDVGHE